MVNAQEWLNKKYPTPEIKATIKRIGFKQDLKRVGDDLLSAVTKGRDLSSFFSSVFDGIANKNNQIEDNTVLEGSLSFKGFINLEELNINEQKITALDVSDCTRLIELSCSNNQLTSLDLSNNQQIEQIGCENNQLTNLKLTGLTKIEKIFGSGNKLTSLEFLKNLDATKIRTLRLDNNQFPAQDLSCFSHLTGLHRLFISHNPFFGSLKPLKNLNELREIGINNTNIDSGLEYLLEAFFKVNEVNAVASSLGLTGGYFKKKLFCDGKLAEQLEKYKIENDSLRNYDWQAWWQDNQALIDKAKEEQVQVIPKIENYPQEKLNKTEELSKGDSVRNLLSQLKTKKAIRKQVFTDLHRQLINQDHFFWQQELAELKEILNNLKGTNEIVDWENFLQTIQKKLQSQGVNYETIEQLFKVQGEINKLKRHLETEELKLKLNHHSWSDTNLHPINQLIQMWQDLNFTPQETQNWLNIGLQSSDHHFVAWLREEIKITSTELLNDSSRIEELREQFQNYQRFQSQIQQLPK